MSQFVIEVGDPQEKWDVFYQEVEASILGVRPTPQPPAAPPRDTEALVLLHLVGWMDETWGST